MSDNLCDRRPCVFCILYSVLWYSTENIDINECSSRSMRGNELVLWEDFLLDLILNLSRKQYVLSESCQLLYLYIYIGIVLFFYCFIACLQHGGITFFISIFYFSSLLRPLFFYDSGCRLSIIWLFTVQRYGGSVRYQTPGDALFG